jgi:hypothetical protein
MAVLRRCCGVKNLGGDAAPKILFGGKQPFRRRFHERKQHAYKHGIFIPNQEHFNPQCRAESHTSAFSPTLAPKMGSSPIIGPGSTSLVTPMLVQNNDNSQTQNYAHHFSANNSSRPAQRPHCGAMVGNEDTMLVCVLFSFVKSSS